MMGGITVDLTDFADSKDCRIKPRKKKPAYWNEDYENTDDNLLYSISSEVGLSPSGSGETFFNATLHWKCKFREKDFSDEIYKDYLLTNLSEEDAEFFKRHLYINNFTWAEVVLLRDFLWHKYNVKIKIATFTGNLGCREICSDISKYFYESNTCLLYEKPGYDLPFKVLAYTFLPWPNPQLALNQK